MQDSVRIFNQNCELVSQLPIEHQGNMDDWLILEKIEDVVKGTSIPYNYENSKFKNEKETAEIVSTMTKTGIL